MSSKRDSDLLIKAFLEEGIDELPERSFDAVRTAIEQTRQWAVIGPWKEPQIMNATRLALAAAAIVLVAVVAIKFLPTTNIGPATSPLPSPTSTPSALTMTGGSGTVPIEAGRHSAGTPFLVPFTFTVPTGWSGAIDGPNLVELNQSLGVDDISFEIFDKVYADPCHNDQGLLNPLPGPTVDDLLAALAKMPSVTVSNVLDTSIGSLPARQVTITAPASFTGCTLTSDGSFRLWELPLGATNDMTPGEYEPISMLEIDGQRLVITTSVLASGVDSEVVGILNSITFTPQP
jgi:hypothetical protein